jgi:predicted phage terminase large subunit-like protein
VLLPSLRHYGEIRKNLAERHLIDFVRLMWPAVEPSNPMVEGWTLDAIADHLEAVESGQIKRLLINVPPGFSKSLITNVFFPAWIWGPRGNPSARFINASYSSSLTERDNVRFGQVIHSPEYIKFWGGEFEAGYSRVKLENSRTGWKLATSVGGVGTGERGDFFLCDDPNSVKEVDSEAVRESTNQWWREVVPTRLSIPSESAIVVIQQRTHEQDVSGITLAGDMGYEHLMIPMRYDSKRHCTTSIGWSDPRSVDGDLCWPERFPEKEVHQLERILGPFATAGQLQQSPSPRGGGIVKQDWIGLWDFPQYPPFEYLVASLDTALTSKQENDYSACVVLGLYRDDYGNPKVMIVYAWQERLEFHDLLFRVAETCKKYHIDKLLIEAKTAGHSIEQEMRRTYKDRSFGIEFYNPTGEGDKVSRVYATQWIYSDGIVTAPDKVWAQMTIDALCAFPRGAHDDLVDAMTQGMQHLRRVGLALRREEQATEYGREITLQDKQTALYPV